MPGPPSATAGFWSDPHRVKKYSRVAAYAQSQLALTMDTRDMAPEGSGITAVSLNPGRCDTALLPLYGSVGARRPRVRRPSSGCADGGPRGPVACPGSNAVAAWRDQDRPTCHGDEKLGVWTSDGSAEQQWTITC
ncbi:hypothetical protein [Kitasatospora sp. NPDC097643]|uniref:hypothetical protein n=1 Tax=Kitasatospora sp. NPDC097643 TaxID=3157230 RepID=UPI0033196527